MLFGFGWHLFNDFNDLDFRGTLKLIFDKNMPLMHDGLLLYVVKLYLKLLSERTVQLV